MSVASPPSSSAKPSASVQPSAAVARRLGSDELIETRIVEACRALWWAELVRTGLGMAVAVILAVLIWVVVDQWIYSPGLVARSLAFLGLVASLGFFSYRRLRPLLAGSINPDYAARSLERDMPDLRHSLTSYVTLRGDRELGDLRSRVVRSIGASTASRLRGHDHLPMEATGTLRWWVATAIALAVLVGYAAFSPKNTLQSAARLAVPVANITPPRRVSIRDVQPGSGEAIAGRSVNISASITGLRSGEEAVCDWELPSGRQQLVLVHDVDQRRHAGELQVPHSASGIVRYSISAGDATSGPYFLRVQDVPVVAIQSVHYTPPKYTGQSPYTSSSGAITAVDGTTIKILANTNRPIAKAKIEFNPRPLGDRIQATAGATEMEVDTDGTTLSVSFPVRSARGRSAAVELENYRILVWDASGQGNPDPIIYPIRIIADLPPEVAITVPASSPKEVPIDAQQIIEVHASDPDFGLKSVSIEIRAGIDLIAEPVLWSSELGEKGHRVAEFPLRPASLKLRIGDTVQVIAIATDNRSSDIYPNFVANVVRTDPVTLKIVASGNVPEENDPNADGLSTPEPSSGDAEQSSEGSKGDSGQQPSGGGGGSGSGAQQQAGGGQGGAGGKGADDDSSEDSSGSGAGGAKGSDSNGADQNTGASSDSTSDATQNGSSTGSDDDRAGAGESGDSGEPLPGSSDPGAKGQDRSEASGTGTDAVDGSERSPGESPTPQPGSGEQQPQPGDGQSSSTGETRGNGAAGNSSRQPGSSNQQPGADSTGEPSGSKTAGESSDEQQTKGSPKHDGEAFERIQEFLEKNRDQGSASPAAANQRQGAQPTDSPRQQPGGAGEGSNDHRDADGQASPKGSQRDQQESQSAAATDATSTQDGGRDSQSTSGDSQSTSGDSTQGSDQGSGQTPPSDGQSPRSGGQSADDRGVGQQPASTGQDGGGNRSEQSNQAAGADQAANAENAGESSPEAGSAGQQNGATDTSSGKGSGATPAQDDSADRPAGDQPSQSGSGSGTGSRPASSQLDPSAESNTTAQASSGGAGEGGDEGDFQEQPAVPPDPVNLEYAKKATDLVLDYLDQTRESPDPKLLEELQWSKEDLQRFTERWRQIREMPSQPGQQGNREIEEALKSLGLRSKDGAARTTRESGDQLDRIRDTGNRQPPPPAFRDAFDAFRRAVGK